MLITKTKTVFPVTLSEVKEHLPMDTNDFDKDNYIENVIIKAATRKAEQLIGKDIAYTTNTYTVYDFYSDTLRVDEGPLVSITDISVNGTLYTSYELQKTDSYFTVEFDSIIGGDDYTLTTHFITGYNNDCPEDIKLAIMVECANLYDIERSSYVLGSLRKSDVFERLLMPHKIILW